MKLVNRLALLLAAPALAVACASDPKVSSGLDGAKSVDSLSEAEKKTLCDAAASAAGDVAEGAKPGACRLAGVVAASFGGGGVEACEAAVTACEDAEPQASGGDGEDSCALDDGGCTATVAEVEACLNAQLVVTKEFLGELGSKSCGELLDPAAQGTISQPAPSAACTAIRETCPAIAGTSTSTSAT
jgi:hypothetical protein